MNPDLTELEEPGGWEEFVEGWWVQQCAALRPLVASGLRDDFLLETIWEPPQRCRDDHHSLFAKFGILHHYHYHWREDFDAGASVVDMGALRDPPWGGLSRWRELERSPVPDDVPPCSPTLVYKASVLGLNLHASGVDLGAVRSMVHWGGGIGLQSLLMRQWGAAHTEYLIDLPAMSIIQYEFLAHNLGPEQVHLASEDVRDGVINVVPLSRLELVPQGCDVFLSLHAISESSAHAQNWVAARDWFGAKKLVLEWTEGIFFEGTQNWEALVAGLEGSGRLAPRDAARGDTFRSRWHGDVARLAELYKEKHGVPVLVLGPQNWLDLTASDQALLDLDMLMGPARPNCPIIILDVTHAMSNRRAFEWVHGRVAMQRYRLEEQDEALIIIDKDLFPTEAGANG